MGGASKTTVNSRCAVCVDTPKIRLCAREHNVGGGVGNYCVCTGKPPQSMRAPDATFSLIDSANP